MTVETKEYKVNSQELIKIVYQCILGREVDPEALVARVTALDSGYPFDKMFIEIATSDEARSRKFHGGPAIMDKHEGRSEYLAKTVEFAFSHFLRRKPSPDDSSHWCGVIRNGMPVEVFLTEIANSEEARIKANQLELGTGLSDGEFFMAASDMLFGQGIRPTEIVAWQQRLETSGESRIEIVSAIINDHVKSKVCEETTTSADYDSDVCSIMGTTRTLSRKQWQERERRLDLKSTAQPDVIPLGERRFVHTGAFVSSMIASLYKGGKFIRRFLDNIVAQTSFDRSELIIIDADSPEREWEVIESYQKIYSNIVYRRINYRLGIYDAWNVGLDLSRGKYITNTNLDDLRRRDSIELQMALLDNAPNVDVVYQDFYYNFDPDLSFEEVERFGFKSHLPIVTPTNLLLFNSPHNAPMWRKSLHDELGPFDIRYKSAGDWEFWMRCLASRKTFRKINIPHVVYYQNPEGISTKADTRGVKEAQEILSRYSKTLTPSVLLQSRRDFHAGIGVEAFDMEGRDRRSYYQVVQDALVKLGGSRGGST